MVLFSPKLRNGACTPVTQITVSRFTAMSSQALRNVIDAVILLPRASDLWCSRLKLTGVVVTRTATQGEVHASLDAEGVVGGCQGLQTSHEAQWVCMREVVVSFSHLAQCRAGQECTVHGWLLVAVFGTAEDVGPMMEGSVAYLAGSQRQRKISGPQSASAAAW